MNLFSKLGTTALALVLGATLPAFAQDLPPEAAALMEPLPLSPTGQVVPGYPDGAPASTADIFAFTDEDVAKLKEGKFTAGLVMHTMDAGWPALQVAGITLHIGRQPAVQRALVEAMLLPHVRQAGSVRVAHAVITILRAPFSRDSNV